MTNADVQSAIEHALNALYTKLPQGESITLNTPLEIIIFDQQHGDHITHYVTSVSKEGIAVFLNNDNHDEENSDQEASYYIHDTDTQEQVLNIYEACKQARPDLFEEARQEPGAFTLSIERDELYALIKLVGYTMTKKIGASVTGLDYTRMLRLLDSLKNIYNNAV